MPTHRSPHPRRRLPALVAACLTVTLAPLPFGIESASAKGPTEAVTGLAIGSRGDAVREVQQALVNQGISVQGGVDGIFGPGTEAALKRFQQQNGLAQSGKVDLATAIALGLEQSSLLGLTQGSRGDAVKTLQQKLSAAGHHPNGGIDGIFGSGTAAAVRAFQQAQGFAATGTVNAATAAALASVSTSGGQGPSEPADEPAPASSGGSSEAALTGLKIGSRGDAVKTVQRTLMGLGFTVVGGADGIYGVLTANAVRSFQNANKLTVSGAVDAATAKLLVQLGQQGGAADADHDPTVSSPFVGLQYGSLGADVKALQQALLDAGITVRGGADGVFGSMTVTAVKQFQKRNGLSQTGKVDQATANALSSSSGGGASAASPLLGLRAGALGNTVKQLQQALLDAGVKVRGGADGIFGPATAAALKSFQSSQGLPATGEVDQATVDALANPKAPVTDGGSSTAGYAQYGEKGSRVLALQSALVKAGIPLRGGVDGDFGGGTAAAVMEFQRRNGLGVTGKVDAATAKALGLAAAEPPAAPDPASVQLAVFPVQGKCYFGDSYGYPRSGGRVHLGVDIIAPEGKLIYAVTDGKISKVYHDYPGSLAGNGVRLSMPDGTYFFYAHMQELAAGIELGVPVKAGQVLGYVGSTGSSGTPHLHLEVHPKGGSAINPYPLVKAIDACSVTAPRG